MIRIQNFALVCAMFCGTITYAQEIPTTLSTTTLESSAEAVKEEEPAIPKEELSEEERTTRIFSAIEENNPDEIKRLISAMTYYRHNENGETALTQAILNQQTELVRLLSERAVINLKNEAGETPLTLAIKQGNEDIIELVLDRAKASLKNEADETPLWLAIETGDLKLMQALIDKGAKVDRYSKGITPVHKCVQDNALQPMALLLRNGANPSKASLEEEQIPLLLAVQNKQHDLAKILLHKSANSIKDANWKNSIGTPLLNVAIHNEDAAMVQTLLKYGARVNEADHMENTSLHLAAELGLTEISELLLEGGADTSSTNIMGETAADMASINGHERLKNLLSDSIENNQSRLASY